MPPDGHGWISYSSGSNNVLRISIKIHDSDDNVDDDDDDDDKNYWSMAPSIICFRIIRESAEWSLTSLPCEYSPYPLSISKHISLSLSLSLSLLFSLFSLFSPLWDASMIIFFFLNILVLSISKHNHLPCQIYFIGFSRTSWKSNQKYQIPKRGQKWQLPFRLLDYIDYNLSFFFLN